MKKIEKDNGTIELKRKKNESDILVTNKRKIQNKQDQHVSVKGLTSMNTLLDKSPIKWIQE